MKRIITAALIGLAAVASAAPPTRPSTQPATAPASKVYRIWQLLGEPKNAKPNAKPAHLSITAASREEAIAKAEARGFVKVVVATPDWKPEPVKPAPASQPAKPPAIKAGMMLEEAEAIAGAKARCDMEVDDTRWYTLFVWDDSPADESARIEYSIVIKGDTSKIDHLSIYYEHFPKRPVSP